MSILHRAIYTFNGIPMKIPSTFFKEMEQIILKFIWNKKRPKIAREMLKKKTKDDGITILDLKLYYKAVITKIVWYWHKNTHTDQCKRVESPVMDSQVYGQLIFELVECRIEQNRIEQNRIEQNRIMSN